MYNAEIPHTTSEKTSTTENACENPTSYQDCIEMNLCPHCFSIDNKKTYVPDTTAAMTQGYCTQKHFDADTKGIPLEQSYQSIKAHVAHEHDQLKEHYGAQQYWKVVDSAPLQTPFTVKHIKKLLEQSLSAVDTKHAA